MRKLSEWSTSHPNGTFRHGTVTILVDGMDQAKFRTPYFRERSKDWQALWKPQLHCVGTIVCGVVECMFLLDCDQPRGANCIITCLSRSFHIANQNLMSRGLVMPSELFIESDKTLQQRPNTLRFLSGFAGWWHAANLILVTWGMVRLATPTTNKTSGFLLEILVSSDRRF